MRELLSNAALNPLRAVMVRMLSGAQFNLGDTSWVIETASGDGEATAVTIGTGATITAYLYQEQITQARAAALGVPVGDTALLFMVTDGAVAVGQVVRSVSDSRRIRLIAERDDPFYPLYLAEAL